MSAAALGNELARDAHAVFLPAIDAEEVPVHVAEFISAGCVSLLIGESRDEYVARQMSPERLERETRADIAALTASVREHADGPTLVAIDQEPGGIQRLQGFAGPLPDMADAAADPGRLLDAADRLAHEAAGLGVNVFLSPIADIVTGDNPWLAGRTLGTDADAVGAYVAGFTAGVQRSGRVAATAKHFPGHPNITGDPAVDADAVVVADDADLELSLSVFRTLLEAGPRVVMTGPAIVPQFDPDLAASRSKATVEALRKDFGFSGVVLSDDLDSAAVLRGDPLDEAVVDALNAGVDWLLVAGLPHVEDLAMGVVDAVRSGRLDAARLHEAAERVRHLAASLER